MGVRSGNVEESCFGLAGGEALAPRYDMFFCAESGDDGTDFVGEDGGVSTIQAREARWLIRVERCRAAGSMMCGLAGCSCEASAVFWSDFSTAFFKLLEVQSFDSFVLLQLDSVM